MDRGKREFKETKPKTCSILLRYWGVMIMINDRDQGRDDELELLVREEEGKDN